MTTRDQETVVAPITVDATLPPSAVVLAPQTPAVTVCGSYKEAKYLAAAQRRSGDSANHHVRATFVVHLNSWCVL
jgi:hypothetical protein